MGDTRTLNRTGISSGVINWFTAAERHAAGGQPPGVDDDAPHGLATQFRIHLARAPYDPTDPWNAVKSGEACNF